MQQKAISAAAMKAAPPTQAMMAMCAPLDMLSHFWDALSDGAEDVAADEAALVAEEEADPLAEEGFSSVLGLVPIEEEPEPEEDVVEEGEEEKSTSDLVLSMIVSVHMI